MGKRILETKTIGGYLDPETLDQVIAEVVIVLDAAGVDLDTLVLHYQTTPIHPDQNRYIERTYGTKSDWSFDAHSCLLHWRHERFIYDQNGDPIQGEDAWVGADDANER